MFFAEYSIYSRSNPHQSVSCLWVARAGVLNVAQVERAMGNFEFLSSTQVDGQSVQEADKALAQGRLLDAQFALAQAYLRGEKNPTVARKLADVSAALDSRVLVKTLAQELLADDPENIELKALHERALKASERKAADGSNEKVPGT